MMLLLTLLHSVELRSMPTLSIQCAVCRHQRNGYLALQGNTPARTSRFEHILKLLARNRLGTHWAKYPFSRCQVCCTCLEAAWIDTQHHGRRVRAIISYYINSSNSYHINSSNSNSINSSNSYYINSSNSYSANSSNSYSINSSKSYSTNSSNKVKRPLRTRRTLQVLCNISESYGQLSYVQFAAFQIEGLESQNHCLCSLQTAL